MLSLALQAPPALPAPGGHAKGATAEPGKGTCPCPTAASAPPPPGAAPAMAAVPNSPTSDHCVPGRQCPGQPSQRSECSLGPPPPSLASRAPHPQLRGWVGLAAAHLNLRVSSLFTFSVSTILYAGYTALVTAKFFDNTMRLSPSQTLNDTTPTCCADDCDPAANFKVISWACAIRL